MEDRDDIGITKCPLCGQLDHPADGGFEAIKAALRMLEEARERAKKMEAALRWYADRGNYEPVGMSPVWSDYGKRAAEALGVAERVVVIRMCTGLEASHD